MVSNVYDNKHFKYGMNQWTGEPNKPVFYTEEMRKKVKFSDHQLSEMERFKAVLPFSDGTYLVRDFNWDTMEDSA